MRRVCAKRKPKKVLVCMLYFLDEVAGGSWADATLSRLGYDSDPATLQLVIRTLFKVISTKGFEVDVLATEWAAVALEWMGQKDSLGQDFFLLGSHGPMRRWLALVYCARANREVEYLALTQDTTESDLKQGTAPGWTPTRSRILPRRASTSACFDFSTNA